MADQLPYSGNDKRTVRQHTGSWANSVVAPGRRSVGQAGTGCDVGHPGDVTVEAFHVDHD